MELRRWKDDSNPYSLPRPSMRDKLSTRLRVALLIRRGRAEVPVHCAGVAAVGRHDLSGDCRLFWLSTHVHLPTFACRFPSGQQSLFEQPGSQQTEHAMSTTLNSSSEIPWWKGQSREQWKAWIAAWLGWTLDASIQPTFGPLKDDNIGPVETDKGNEDYTINW